MLYQCYTGHFFSGFWVTQYKFYMKIIKIRYRFIFARKGVNTSGKGLIQIEVAFNRQLRKLISTGIYINKEQWDKKRKQINAKHPNAIRLNENLINRVAEIEAYELDQIRKDKPFTPTDLKKFLNYGGDDFYTLAEISVNRDGKLNESGRQKVLSHLKTFNDTCGPIPIGELSYLKIKEFDNYLKKQNYQTNTIGSYHKNLKRTINALIHEGEIKENPYNKFKIVKVKTNRTYLTPAEVKKLIGLNYTDGKQNTLDRFLISCGTGLRFSDCFMLHSSQIYEGEHGLVIDLARMIKVEFPLKNPAYQYFDAVAQERLRKYLKPDSYLFFNGQKRTDSKNATDNQNLKLIAIDAGINKPLSFHASRHTALTEVAAQTGNVFSVMKFGGIRKVDTAMVYIHLASEKF